MSNETQEKTAEAKSMTIMQAPAPLALKGDTFDELFRQAKALSPSSLIPKHLRGKDNAETLANVTMVLAQGRELGLGPVASLSGIAIVNGKPFVESKTLAAVVMASGKAKYLRRVESSPKSVTWETWRHGAPEPERRTFTMEDAQRAGLSGRDTYKQHPERMLSARSLGWLLNDVYPDETRGMGTETEREDAVCRAAVEAAPPPVGVAGLKATLLKRQDTPQDVTPEPTREPLPASHPDAEPPEPGSEG